MDDSPGDKRARQLGVYEMLWDCKFCGTKKLLGKTHRHCPNCGAAQDPNTRYFPADDEKIAVQDHVYYGADVICPACDTPNSAKAQYCVNCGAALTEAARVKTLASETRAEGERFESSGPRSSPTQEQYEADMRQAAAEEAARASARRNRWLMIGGIAALVVIVVAVLAAVFWTRGTTALVIGHSWERAIDIERYGPQSESAWCDSMPYDAYNVSRRDEIRSYRQVPDGEECSVRRIDNGDGTYREEEECQTRYRDEPVYDDRCYFTVDRWAYSHTVTARGESLREAPSWPATNIARSGTCIGCEREAGRQERYQVHFQESGSDKTYTCDFDQSKWGSFGLETLWKLEVSALTGQPKCNSLERAN